MNFTEKDVSKIIYHANRYGAHRFFQGTTAMNHYLQKMTNKERDKALYHYNQILKILKLE